MEKPTQEVILIVDDLPNNLGVLLECLTDSGYEVLVALDGESAIEQVEYAQPDLILLDVLMPGIDGFETCRRLKSQSTTKEIPIIFITSLADTEYKVKGFDFGGVDYITKPIQQQEVLSRVKTHLALRKLQKQLQQKNEFLQKEISVRLQVEAELKERTTQLEIKNQELDAFTHSVAHDLRSPITSIRGYNACLEREYGEMLDGHGKYFIERVNTATKRMEQLIEDLMLLSQVKGTKMAFEEVDLGNVSQEIITGLRQTYPEREVEFICSTGLSTIGDRRLLKILLENLLGNAWKYTAKKPKATIEFGIMKNEVESQPTFFVRDDGVGFDMAYASKLFSPFQRLHNRKEFPGSGVGLATVERIVVRHGGRIWIEAAVDLGATVYFSFSAI